LENAIDILDTIKIYMLKIDFNVIAFLDYEKAIEIGIDVLKSLGVSLKRHPTEEEVKSALEDISNLLQTNGDEMLQNLPLMTDPKIIAAANILSAMFWTTYRSGSLIFQMCGITSVQLSLKYGIVPESAFGFIWSGITFCLYDDFEPAIKLADFGVELSRRLAPKNLRPKMEQLYYYMIFRFRGHCKKSIEKLHELLQIAMENGEFLDAIAMSHGITCLMFSAGMELEKVKEHTFAYYQKSLELNFRSIAGMFAVELQKFQNLMEETETPWILSGEFFDINQLMPILEEKEDFFSIASLKNSTMFLAFHFEKYQIAYESAQYCYPYAKNNLAPDHMYFIYAFTCLALYPDVESDKQKELLEQIEILEQKLKRWAEQSPVTYLHEYCLIKAEKANVFGENWEAIEYYDKAINAARENKFIHRVALGNELAGKFYLSRNKPKVAKIYLKEAHYNYTLWGAMAKAKHLEKKYPDLLKKQKTHSATPTKSSTDETSVTDLDLNNVLQASQAISSEINLERLLKKIMKIVIENAGAQKGFLLLETDNHWFIEAESDVDKEDIPVLQSIPMEESQELSCGVVNYVSRKKEPVVLGDASAEGIFMADPYIQAKQPKSVLCMPLINQGKLNGILYLENNLLTDVFMEDRLQLLNLLSSQLAISVENSMLYTKLEKSRKRLYTFLEAVPVGIFVVDKFGKPFYANEKASWMLNQGKEEPITPENITGIYADYAAQKFPEIYQVYIAGTNRVYPSKRQPIVRALNGETATVEDMELHIGDQIILLEVWGTPVFDEKGDVAYAIAAFQDITKRKQVERLLDRYSKNLEKEVEKRTAELADKNEQLIQLNRDKSEILSIVAHDLKNPLAALQGFADIISRHIKDYPETKLMQCSQNIVTNAKRMFNIINKMLDVNAIEEGKIIFRKEKQDVRIIVGFLVDGYKNQASDKRITIKFDIPDEPCHVLSDKEVLTQIFDNLISNAIKYSPFDEQIVINVYRKADKIHFEVKDNGQGLSDNDQKKLFKKFARLSPKPTDKEHSTGLGLYIVKKLLDGINGKIWCESEPGNGTTFSVELSAYDFSEPA
jgi:signal transduction histidine kinase/GAF domain-containing protein